ncbi:MAG: glycerol-3-phosphate dehydrogenase/oxidase [Myxococcota bacterium]|nr:glycerol-3-phosphate dehydrogenase/oxidase [Myxococcota bacterium]
MPGELSISAATRAATLDRLERERFDLVVVGGGITGAGVARAATLAGLSVALLDAHDFASGTSSRSSKLIHGGLRYLALGDVGLVREAALERKQVFRIAPHLAEPRWMVVPARSRAALAKLRIGISTYEKLGAVEAPDRHQNWSGSELAREEPVLDRERFPHACAYREYLTDDARLVLANLRAAVGVGSAVLNYAPVEAMLLEQGRAVGVEAACRLTGRRVRVRARVVVNAAGPWVEAVQRLETPDAPLMLHLSKGIHVTLDAERLPVRNMLVLSASDRRSLFAIRRGEVVYLGTTDTSYARGAERWPTIEREEVNYLLEPLARYFDVAAVEPRHVLGAWAGLRPLIGTQGTEPQELSRRDEVISGAAGVVTVAGGKLTGYRPMAERVLEAAGRVLGHMPAPCEDDPLPGGDFSGDLASLSAGLERETGVAARTAARLVRLYGAEAHAVVTRGPNPIVPGASLLSGEVDWGVMEEGATSVRDLLYRRTRTALYEPGESERVLDAVAVRMAELLDWSGERTAQERSEMRARLAADLDFREAGAPQEELGSG